MKFSKGIKALCILFVTLFMFTGCEWIALAALANGLSDMDLTNLNGVNVVNATGETITLEYEEDPSEVTEGYTRKTGSIVLRNGETKENAFTGGYYKLTINGIQVFPSGVESVENYYLIGGYSTLTVKKLNLLYFYENQSRVN